MNKKPYLDLINLRYELEVIFIVNANSVNQNTILIQFSGSNIYYTKFLEADLLLQQLLIQMPYLL